MLIRQRAYLKRQPIHLPPINPCFDPPHSLLTVETNPKFNTIHVIEPDKEVCRDLFKRFERDFNSNKLETEFDQLLDTTLKERKQDSLSEEQFIKEVSSEIKLKMFEKYVKRRRSKSRAKSLLKISDAAEPVSTSHILLPNGNEDKSHSSLSYVDGYAGGNGGERVFGVMNTIRQLEDKAHTRSVPRKYRNCRLYY